MRGATLLKVLILQRARSATIPDCYYFRLTELSPCAGFRTAKVETRSQPSLWMSHHLQRKQHGDESRYAVRPLIWVRSRCSAR